MAHIRKLRRKWQVQVRKQKIKVTKSFWKKSDASKWALKTEVQIETGSYLNHFKFCLQEYLTNDLLHYQIYQLRAHQQYPCDPPYQSMLRL